MKKPNFPIFFRLSPLLLLNTEILFLIEFYLRKKIVGFLFSCSFFVFNFHQFNVFVWSVNIYAKKRTYLNFNCFSDGRIEWVLVLKWSEATICV